MKRVLADVAGGSTTAGGSSATGGSSFLGDPLFWAIIAVVVAVVVPVMLYHLARKRKALAYTMASGPLLAPDYHDAFEITFMGRPVRNVSLIEVLIGNVGNVPIRREDYEKPLSLEFNDDARILSVQVLTTRPLDLDPQLEIRDGEIAIAPLMLNRGDGMTLHVLVDNFDGDVRLVGRIVGISEFRAGLGLNQDVLALDALPKPY